MKKLDLPVFEGQNPDGWILRAERYFSFYRLGEDEKLEAAVVSLDGDALLWYQWEHQRRPLRRWEELKGMLLKQFRPSSAGTLYEQWLNHSQLDSVFEYRQGFIELMAPLQGVPEEIAKGQYINGLKDEIKSEVRLLGPISLDQAMDLSVKVEDKLRSAISRSGKLSGTSFKGASSYYSGTSISSPKSSSSYYSPSAKSLSVQSQASTAPSGLFSRGLRGYRLRNHLGK